MDGLLLMLMRRIALRTRSHRAAHRSHRAAHRAHDTTRARALAGLAVAGLAGLLLTVAPSASATTVTASLGTATQSATGRLVVNGWVADRAHPAASVRVSVWVDGRYVRTALASRPRADVNRALHLTGGHGLRLGLDLHGIARRVALRTHDRYRRVLAVLGVRQESTPGARIVAVAKRYVGARYVEGGASPRGFDCSGYTQYAYAQAHVASLPHNAEAQRRRARVISRAQARPGDLVFYLSGGSAYHVAIYAGNGRQYAAATPRDGVRYQPIWSSAVRFGTTWH